MSHRQTASPAFSRGNESADVDKRLVMEIHRGGLCERVGTAGRPFGAEVLRGLGNHIFHVHIKDMERRDSLDVTGAREIRGCGIFTDELLGDGDVDHRHELQTLREYMAGLQVTPSRTHTFNVKSEGRALERVLIRLLT